MEEEIARLKAKSIHIATLKLQLTARTLQCVKPFFLKNSNNIFHISPPRLKKLEPEVSKLRVELDYTKQELGFAVSRNIHK